MTSFIEFKKVTKAFDSTVVLNNISFSIHEDKITLLLVKAEWAKVLC